MGVEGSSYRSCWILLLRELDLIFLFLCVWEDIQNVAQLQSVFKKKNSRVSISNQKGHLIPSCAAALKTKSKTSLKYFPMSVFQTGCFSSCQPLKVFAGEEVWTGLSPIQGIADPYMGLFLMLVCLNFIRIYTAANKVQESCVWYLLPHLIGVDFRTALTTWLVIDGWGKSPLGSAFISWVQPVCTWLLLFPGGWICRRMSFQEQERWPCTWDVQVVIYKLNLKGLWAKTSSTSALEREN